MDFIFLILERIFSEVIICIKRVAFGINNLRGPFFRFGGGSTIRLKSGGKLKFGKISVRRGVSFFIDGGVIELDDGVFINNYCSFNSMDKISIGKDTMIGEGVRIYDHNHSFDEMSYPEKNKFKKSQVRIGARCWIGANVIILKGVEICDGVTIGAGSIVSKSISDPGIYVNKNSSGLFKLDGGKDGN